MRKSFLFVAFAAFISFNLIGSAALAQRFPSKPPRSDFFVDEAGLINPSDRQQINQIARDLLREEKVALIVVTIPSLLAYDAAHLTVEDYAADLFNHWGIGSQERNYGMLLLVSRDDRRARIELGSTWSGRHDDQARQVMDNLIIPQFRSKNFSGGIIAGVRGMNAMARGLALPKQQQPWWVLPVMLGGVVLTICVIVSLFRNGQKGWGWALIAVLGLIIFFILRAAATNSGSGGAFGGGSSGGGGASGSW